MPTLHELHQLGQSPWYDGLRRGCLTSGELQELIALGLRGISTSHALMAQTVAGSADYDEDLRRAGRGTLSPAQVCEILRLDDVTRAADLFRPLYDESEGNDGYVSVGMPPAPAQGAAGMVAEARRLFAALQRPNVMIEVPATATGLPALTALIAAGVNVNASLIFSPAQYDAVLHACLSGLEQRLAAGGDLRPVAAMASVSVSPVDTAVEAALAVRGNTALPGAIALANARAVYAQFRARHLEARWEKLAQAGARRQRLLWTGTGTTNPAHSDTKYVDQLIGDGTASLLSPATLHAFLDHGVAAPALAQGLDQARVQLQELAALGIDFETVARRLQEQGMAAAQRAFARLLIYLEEKQQLLRAGRKRRQNWLGAHQPAVDRALAELRDHKAMFRMWRHDHTLWQPEPTEITNRLGWLHSPEIMTESLHDLTTFADAVRAEGYTHVLLLGMGGSSLAPEVFRFTFGVRPGFPDLAVLDSTAPAAVLTHARRLDLKRTLFLVSTKSGGTVETFSFFKYFYNLVTQAAGPGRAGRNFVAITDPGSGLVDTAQKYGFRRIFVNDPNIGGRYSALSLFGLVPAALIGVDLARLLERAQIMAANCAGCNCPVTGDNTGAGLGAVMGELARAGRDKVTFFTSPAIASFGSWVEQLIAESTGKAGTGILPVTGEEPGPPEVYASDRLFVWLHLADDHTHANRLQALQQAGHPVVEIELRDLHDLGGEFFRWEVATAIASHRLGINPFDQPNVESAKILARQMVAEYQAQGRLPQLTPAAQEGEMMVFADFPAENVAQALAQFLALANSGEGSRLPRSYVALQVYLAPSPEMDTGLQKLATAVRDRLHLATTVGYGPRFLHSTGQLHKGDAGHGLFIQITAAALEDAPIPDEAGQPDSAMSFHTLLLAQSLGDRQALLDNGRHVLRVDLGRDPAGGLAKLAAWVPSQPV